MGRDPIEEAGGLNLYGFCRNNAINMWDYLGMDAPPVVRPGTLPGSGFSNGVVGASTFSPSLSFGVSGTGTATASPIGVGGSGQVTIGAGVFVSPGDLQVSGFAAYGYAAGPLGVLNDTSVSTGQVSFNPIFGLFLGGAGAVWFSNAGTAKELASTTKTYSFNIAFGTEVLGIAVSVGESGIWQVTIAPPGSGPGWGIDGTAVSTTTETLTIFALNNPDEPSSSESDESTNLKFYLLPIFRPPGVPRVPEIGLQ